MINELTNFKDLTMSSRDIAELVESRHDSVKRAIERLAENGVISRPPLVDGAKSSNGVVEKVYVFNAESKRDTFIVVAQLSPKFTARLVDRWQELEEQAAGGFKIPKTRSEALRLAADLEERNELLESKNLALEHKIETDRPKVEFAEAVRNLDGSCLVREFAKVLGTGQNRLYKRLREDGFLMANNEPYQHYIDRGWFVRIEGIPFTDSNGKAHPTFVTRITGKGQVGLEKRYRDLFAPAEAKVA